MRRSRTTLPPRTTHRAPNSCADQGRAVLKLHKTICRPTITFELSIFEDRPADLATNFFGKTCFSRRTLASSRPRNQNMKDRNYLRQKLSAKNLGLTQSAPLQVTFSPTCQIPIQVNPELFERQICQKSLHIYHLSILCQALSSTPYTRSAAMSSANCGRLCRASRLSRSFLGKLRVQVEGRADLKRLRVKGNGSSEIRTTGPPWRRASPHTMSKIGGIIWIWR